MAEDYGTRHGCNDTAEATHARQKKAGIADIFDIGLHEFLSEFIVANNRLGEEIGRDFRFY